MHSAMSWKFSWLLDRILNERQLTGPRPAGPNDRD